MTQTRGFDPSRESIKDIGEQTIAELFPDSLTDSPCVFIDHDREIWLATEMCAEYTESSVDQIVVLDKNNLIGTVGGYDLLAHIRINPTRRFQYESKVEDAMFHPVSIIEKNIRFKDLMEQWKHSRRAFSIFRLGFEGSWLSVSARKMLQVGMKIQADLSTLSIQKNRIVTFRKEDTIGNILDLMYKNMTRKLLLEGSSQFISDRIILGEISRILKFEEGEEDILNIPISHIRLEYAPSIKDDLKLSEACSLMNKSDHPYLMYKDTVVTPWDICIILSKEELQVQRQQVDVCPCCGRSTESR